MCSRSSGSNGRKVRLTDGAEQHEAVGGAVLGRLEVDELSARLHTSEPNERETL